MLVTNRDVLIGDYAVRSYQKVEKAYGDALPFVLLIYANCLSEANKKKFFPRWKKYSYVDIFDNTDFAKGLDLTPGTKVGDGEGGFNVIEGPRENYDTVWSRELRKIETPYHATVDADFEILDPAFVGSIMDFLDRNPTVVGMSTDHSPYVANRFDTYSGQVIHANERWHTWFCVYRKRSRICRTSHYYYETIGEDGIRSTYDSAARFQHDLITKYGCSFASLPESFGWQFIHYGAFSKNVSITERNLWLYRFLEITGRRGVIVRTKNRKLNAAIAASTMRWARWCLQRFFKRHIEERSVYHFDLD